MCHIYPYFVQIQRIRVEHIVKSHRFSSTRLFLYSRYSDSKGRRMYRLSSSSPYPLECSASCTDFPCTTAAVPRRTAVTAGSSRSSSISTRERFFNISQRGCAVFVQNMGRYGTLFLTIKIWVRVHVRYAWSKL